MKTKFLSLLALMMLCFNSADTNATTLPLSSSFLNEFQEANKEEGVFFKLKIHFERGRRNEQGQCHDRGVCDFDIEIGFRAVNPGGLDGEIRNDRYGNVLLIIEKGSITADEAVDITGFAEGPGTLRLSNNSEIPDEVKAELGLSSKYQFKAGNYQVTETSTTYVVNFGK